MELQTHNEQRLDRGADSIFPNVAPAFRACALRVYDMLVTADRSRTRSDLYEMSNRAIALLATIVEDHRQLIQAGLRASIRVSRDVSPKDAARLSQEFFEMESAHLRPAAEIGYLRLSWEELTTTPLEQLRNLRDEQWLRSVAMAFEEVSGLFHEAESAGLIGSIEPAEEDRTLVRGQYYVGDIVKLKVGSETRSTKERVVPDRIQNGWDYKKVFQVREVASQCEHRFLYSRCHEWLANARIARIDSEEAGNLPKPPRIDEFVRFAGGLQLAPDMKILHGTKLRDERKSSVLRSVPFEELEVVETFVGFRRTWCPILTYGRWALCGYGDDELTP